MLIYATGEVLRKGLLLVGYSERALLSIDRKAWKRRFKAHFGSTPKVCAELWEALQVTQIDNARVTNPSEKDFNNYLITLYFLKSYPTEEELSSRFGIHETTARKWIRYFVDKISSLLPERVIWPEDNEWDTTYIISVDCVNFGTLETRHPTLHKDKKLFDRKGGKAGLTYEIGLHLWLNRVVWINGPFPPNDGGDRAIFVEKGLQDAIPEGKKAIADKIYKGLPKIALHNSLDCEEVRIFKRRARARQESINARLKNFGILKQRFRHKKAHQQHKAFTNTSKHQAFVHAIMVICTIQMQHGSPLFNV
jgi:hypothetical protein